MFRKGVSAIILNSSNEFLLINLKSFEERFFAVPGGGVEEGETLEQAVYREVQEELGIDKESLEYVSRSDVPVKTVFEVIKLNRDGHEYAGSERYFFGFRFIGKDDEIIPRVDEIRKYTWVTFAELDKYLLFDGQLTETVEKIGEIFPAFK